MNPQKTDKHFFYRMLISFSIVITLTIAILSSILYINFENISKKQVFETTRSNLYQSSYSINYLAEYVEGLALQIVSDKSIISLMSPTSKDPVEYSYSLDRLQNYRYVSQMLHSVYVYNRKTSSVFFSASTDLNMISNAKDFFDKEILEYIPNLHNYKRLSPIPRTINVPSSSDRIESSTVYTYIYYDLFSNSNYADNIVILNISSSWLFNTLQSMEDNPNDEKYTFIIDNTGKTVFSNDSSKMISDMSNEPYIEEILSSENDSGYLITNHNGKKTLVTYVKPKYNDWCLISTLPYDTVVGSINHMKTVTLIIGLLILFAGIFVASFVSQKLYKPVGVVFSRLSTLENEKIANMADLKNKFFIALLNGNVHENSQNLIKEFGVSGNMHINVQAPLQIILLRLDHYSTFCSEYNFADRKEVKSRIQNIASEVLTSSTNFDSIDMEDDKLALILNPEGNDIPTSSEYLRQQLEVLQEKLQIVVGISISFSLSSIGHTYRDLPFLYAEVLNISRYRFTSGHKCILFPEDIPDTILIDADHPLQREKDLTEAIMLEKHDITIQIYKQFLLQLAATPVEICHHFLNQLFFVIKSSFQKKINDMDALSSVFNNIYESLQKSETLVEVDNSFMKLFDEVFSYIQDIKKAKYDDLVQRIMTLIESQFHSNILSVNSIADEVHMSAAYLSKLFKQLTSKSIPDYISEVRLTKSKELLKSTDMSINIITQKTGFTNSSYFYMVFKKEFGITPSQFRQLEQVVAKETL